VEDVGGFVLVHVNTPLDVCEARDRKGLYEKARAGLVEHFTGVSDAYEEPTDADVVVDAAVLSPEEASDNILAHLVKRGYL
jgi:sulfate adenylyltransferase